MYFGKIYSYIPKFVSMSFEKCVMFEKTKNMSPGLDFWPFSSLFSIVFFFLRLSFSSYFHLTYIYDLYPPELQKQLNCILTWGWIPVVYQTLCQKLNYFFSFPLFCQKCFPLPLLVNHTIILNHVNLESGNHSWTQSSFMVISHTQHSFFPICSLPFYY